jgi:hypothetical protein
VFTFVLCYLNIFLSLLSCLCVWSYGCCASTLIMNNRIELLFRTHTASYSMSNVLFSGVRRLDRSLTSSVEVKSYTSSPPICLHGINRDTFNCYKKQELLLVLLLLLSPPPPLPPLLLLGYASTLHKLVSKRVVSGSGNVTDLVAFYLYSKAECL